MEFMWKIPYGFQVDIPYGMVESMWNLAISCGIWVEWNHQNGCDSSQNIFHMEWVESIWNDMDSTWIPCGMWGQGKDLEDVEVSRVMVVVEE